MKYYVTFKKKHLPSEDDLQKHEIYAKFNNPSEKVKYLKIASRSTELTGADKVNGRLGRSVARNEDFSHVRKNKLRRYIIQIGDYGMILLC